MSIESNRQRYLQQLGIETWHCRVGASFFPGTAQNVSGFVDQQMVVEPDSNQASDETIYTKTEEPAIQKRPVTQYYCVFKFIETNCIVAIETDSFEEPLSQGQKRILIGILRAIGIFDLPLSTPVFLENVSEIQPILKGNMLLLYFGEATGIDFTEHAGKVFYSDSLHRIASSADAKRNYWMQLKKWNISNSFIG